ncbi:hypothetical protein J7F03_20595 [Streptomyces sp. ISL-43]|uniref:hypothetical protein n=1 Tax=Streptomyces sp. ISL-43 TaxID=2819183 RepID=UPI001BE573F0|nr:hypothetical protein [Streptomyces sp. ISL-43]MBT2449443.1 hypothetical protein [Streptomyces sp. ISL-43]
MIATGSDEYSQALAARIGQFIIDADSGSARSQQRAIGPSEIGEPCERQLSYKLLDWPETSRDRDPIAAIIGTGFHMWMAAQFEARQAPLPDGRPRYRIEERVTVRQGPTEASTTTGSSDLFDRLALLNNDWKLVGKSSHDKYRRQGPSTKYRVQAHLYGLGQENAGHTPARVAVTFIGRHHELMVHVWSEPYDRQIALDALARLDRIRDTAQALELDLHPENWRMIPIPEKPECRFCPWLKPGSDDLATGCPGAPSPNAGASLEALIA